MVAIMVVLTIVVFILADSIVQWNQAKKEREAQARDASWAGSPRPEFMLEGVTVPGGHFVDVGHTWVALDPSGRAKVGLDNFAQQALGRIDEVDLPEIGQEIRRGQRLFAIRQGERTAAFSSPVDGVISSVNDTLARDAGTLQADPYEQGWICRVTPGNLAKNLRQLFIAEEAVEWIKAEIYRFQEFISGRPLNRTAFGHVLQDGGQPTTGVLELMDDETWDLFNSKFLGSDIQEREEG